MSELVTTDGFDWQATDETFGDSVMIRVRLARGPSIYAVFDGENKVSGEYGPLNDTDCIAFAEGYAKGREDYRR